MRYIGKLFSLSKLGSFLFSSIIGTLDYLYLGCFSTIYFLLLALWGGLAALAGGGLREDTAAFVLLG